MKKEKVPESWKLLLSYSIVGLLLAFSILNIYNSKFDWAFFSFLTATIALIPSLIERDRKAIAPPELLLLASLPYILALNFSSIQSLIEISRFVAITSLSMIIVIQIHLFTEVEMTSRFAAFFVIVSTAAMASIWPIAQFYSDLYLNTQLLSNLNEMMWDIILATGTGVIGGIIFEIYLKYMEPQKIMAGEGAE